MNDTHTTPTNSVAVAYMRTATAEQAGSRIGLERQLRTCEQHARALGLRLGMIYADVGVSGLSERRPALDQLMRDLARGRIGYVVIAAPYRLARSWAVDQRIRNRIRSQGATISSPCDSRQDTKREEEV
jgi:DNA invertase Pin-like site-specific DNA recombinase